MSWGWGNGLQKGGSSPLFAKYDPDNWILALGAWEDTGIWLDAETWDDGA